MTRVIYYMQNTCANEIRVQTRIVTVAIIPKANKVGNVGIFVRNKISNEKSSTKQGRKRRKSTEAPCSRGLSRSFCSELTVKEKSST